MEANDEESFEETVQESPDFDDAGSVCLWFGKQILALVHLARREKALTRLRAMSSALDSWSRLFRLSIDTADLQELRDQLDELKRSIEAERRNGPTGVVERDGK